MAFRNLRPRSGYVESAFEGPAYIENVGARGEGVQPQVASRQGILQLTGMFGRNFVYVRLTGLNSLAQSVLGFFWPISRLTKASLIRPLLEIRHYNARI